MKLTYLFLFFCCAQMAWAQGLLPEHKWLRNKMQTTSPYQQTLSTPLGHFPRNGEEAIRTALPPHYGGELGRGSRSVSSVPPLLPDQWDQEGPLCGMTPLIDGKHAAVGCVALSMAQVMHKWKHPEWGTGSLTYDDSLGCGQVLTADFYKHHYDWENMLDQYIEGQYTQQQADAAALLCSDCGISVRMKYGTSSAATPIWQAIALPTYFGYDEGVQIYFRDFYT